MIISSVTFFDILISLLTIGLILGIANIFRPKAKNQFNRYYFPFIIFKILTAILFVLIHVYYYKGGDTFLYYSGARFIANQILVQPTNILNLMLSSQHELTNILYESNFIYALNTSSDVFFLSKIVGIFSLFTLNQYLATSILFTTMCSIGVWKLYIFFCNLYPALYKYFALGILFYPSLGIWSSGILKDPLTLCCVGLITSSVFTILNNKKYSLAVITILFSSYFCFVLKPYILYTFIPVMLYWAQSQLSKKLRNPFLKVVARPFILLLFVIGGYFAVDSISSNAGKYSLDSVQSVAEGFHSWHSYLAETRDQSGYSLGEVSFTPIGILQKSPEAFFVTYYRPFIIGDVRNVATLFEAIQNLILLGLTLMVIFKAGMFNFFKILFTNNNARAFMIFAVVFGIAVGLTSYNFGALSRYKIPSLPFFIASLAIIYYEGYLKQKMAKKNSN